MVSQQTLKIDPAGKRGYRYYFRTGKIQVDYETGCWIWLGAQYDDGYGKIRLPGGRSGMPVRSQAYFWRLYRGDTHGKDVGHNCHRRLCVKLRHLQLVSHMNNMQTIFQEYPFGDTDKNQVRDLWNKGFDHTYIADAIMAPRVAVVKLLKRLDLLQPEIPF